MPKIAAHSAQYPEANVSNDATGAVENLDDFEVVPVPFEPGEFMAVFRDGSYGRWIPKPLPESVEKLGERLDRHHGVALRGRFARSLEEENAERLVRPNLLEFDAVDAEAEAVG